ncbi:HNH endonuclease signature motif containing protein [Kribbella shirazensis]|uniref:HNH nuclease domain-containing protein n=1 Tax=Kribbella shirazensis TaxID=1105143 RepID=A0A7X5VAN5_9ACTN|nr:HNH endonuclease signature motif containing protein [Kribbella shirazensis]NIK57735.1 hypothetical protein [Kribbella shirazensis]
MESSGQWSPELMSDQELVRALDRADADLARVETRRLRLIAALDARGYAEQVGARDTVQFVEYRYRLDHHRARRDVQLARALPKYAAVTAALPDTLPDAEPDSDFGERLAGESSVPAVLLRPAQAEAIVTALEKVPTTVPVTDLEVAERELVRLAKHLPPADLRKAAEQTRDILDTDGPEPEEHKAYARETLTLSRADRGVKFRGYLANENAELLRSLITAAARPHKTIDGAPDPRTREKRQADALTTTLTLAATALDTGTPSPTIPRPTAGCGVVVDLERGAGAEMGAAVGGGAGAGLGGSGGDVVPGFGAKANITVTIDLHDLTAATADAVGDTVYSGGLSAATIRRLACDAKVIPLVLGAHSEPLDVGRCERLVTRAMRRALNARDRGCVVCGAPPVMCDAHHLISWIDGGETKVTNLALLCRRHHVDLHNGHWTITITDGIVHVARPTWADPPPSGFPKPPVGLRKPPSDLRTSPGDLRTSPGDLRTSPSDLRKSLGDLPKPPGDTSRAPGPVGAGATRPDPSGGGVTSTDNPCDRTSSPSVDPWGGTALPAATATGLRSGRWRADRATYAEAARFAVWGMATTNEAGTGPPSFATI